MKHIILASAPTTILCFSDFLYMSFALIDANSITTSFGAVFVELIALLKHLFYTVIVQENPFLCKYFDLIY